MISLSELDTQRFGVRTARANDVKAENVSGMDVFCQKENVEFLIARCDTKNIQVAHALEASGHRLMDTLVYYIFSLQKKEVPTIKEETFNIRLSNVQDEAQLKKIAVEAFTDYADGHYHNDPRLDKKKCTEVYVDWASRSIAQQGTGDVVIVVEEQKKILGFLTLQETTHDMIELVLSGVSKEHQGRGLYKILISAGLEMGRKQGKKCVITSTQLTNLAVQKVWTRLGFEPAKSMYTFHKWYV